MVGAGANERQLGSASSPASATHSISTRPPRGRAATASPDGPFVHRLFAAWAARQPEAPAVVDAQGQLSYAELEARANRLAHWLLAHGLEPEEAAARDRGAAILPVIVSPCRIETVPELAAFQAVNPPPRTLAEMSGPECDRALIRLVDAVQGSLAGDRVD